MKYLVGVFATLMLVAALLPGCAPSPAPVVPPHTPAPGATPSATPMDNGQSTATPTPTRAGGEQVATPTCTPELVVPDEAGRLVLMAKEDLARRLEISVSEISVISVEAVDWPDTSLGCPQPGMAYAQVITPGYLIVLGAKGQACEYHTDCSRVVLWCESDGELLSKGTDGTVDDGWPSQPVDEGEVDTSRITPIVPLW